jgi:hypothetical protein
MFGSSLGVPLQARKVPSTLDPLGRSAEGERSGLEAISGEVGEWDGSAIM